MCAPSARDRSPTLTLRAFPNINSSFNGDTLIRHNRVNVGIAVALDEGLINVVSHDADVTPLTVMAPRHKEMIARARAGKVKPDDVEGQTFVATQDRCDYCHGDKYKGTLADWKKRCRWAWRSKIRPL